MKTVISITIDRGSGGIANSLLSYSRALALIDCKHVVIVPDDAAVLNGIQHCPNVEVILFKKWLLKLHMMSRFVFCPRLRTELARADAILLHNARLCRQLKQYRHTYVVNHSGKTRHLEHANNIIFLTTAAQQRFLSSNKARKDRINQFVIGHGFEDVIEGDVEHQPYGTVSIIAAGRFVEKKRFQDLVAAASLLKDESLPFEIHIYGQGTLKEELQNRVIQERCDNVFLHDWTPELSKQLKQSDIFCLTSSEEPFGLVVGEAMLCRLPVVTTDTDGPLDLLGRNNPQSRGGLIYHAGDVPALAAALIRLSQSQVLREEMGKAGRKNILDNFSIKSLADKLNMMLSQAG